MAASGLSKPSTRLGAPKFGPPPLQLAGETSKARKAGSPSKRLTQEDQDKADKEKQQEALGDLVQSWLTRLQLISVITTFFASTESGMLGRSLPTATEVLSVAGQIANICFMGALIVHAYAAVMSFLGAFFLVGYKLMVDEEESETGMVDSPTSISSDPEKTGVSTSSHTGGLRTDPIQGRVRNPHEFLDQVIRSTNPHLVQVGPFQGQPPIELLSRCHSLCVFLAFLGFVLAIIGLMSFAWDRLPLSIGISASVAMGFCLIAGTLILVFPSTKTSHIYYERKSR